MLYLDYAELVADASYARRFIDAEVRFPDDDDDAGTGYRTVPYRGRFSSVVSNFFFTHSCVNMPSHLTRTYDYPEGDDE